MVYKYDQREYSVKLTESQKVNDEGYIQLNERPDESMAISVSGFFQTYDIDKKDLQVDQFKCNIKNGRLYFHSSKIGQTFSVIYWGTGSLILSGDFNGIVELNSALEQSGGAAALADAVFKKHTQNTDTGTTSATFILDSDGNPLVLMNVNGTFKVGISGSEKEIAFADGSNIEMAEKIQDAIGSALTDTDTIDLIYDDTANKFKADVKDGSITDNLLGTRTINDEITDPVANTGSITQLQSWLAQEIKKIKGSSDWKTSAVDTLAGLETKIGDLSLLNTTVRSNLVGAINELKTEINLGGTVENANYLGGHEGNFFLQRSNHEGKQLASTISDFEEAVTAIINDIAKVYVQKGGAVIGSRKNLNFIEGNNVNLEVTENSTNDSVDVKINSIGGQADKVKITDTNNRFTSDNVEGALDELGTNIGNVSTQKTTAKTSVGGINELYDKTESLSKPNPNLLYDSTGNSGLDNYTDFSNGHIGVVSTSVYGCQFRCISNTSGSPYYLQSSNLGIPPNWKFTVSVDMYTKTITTGQISIDIYCTNGTINTLVGSIIATNETDFTRYYKTVTTLSDSNALYIQITMNNNTNGTGIWRRIKIESGDVSTLFTQEADIQKLFDKNNALSTSVSTNTSNIATLTSEIGNLTSLPTTNKSSLVAALTETYNKIGTASNNNFTSSFYTGDGTATRFVPLPFTPDGVLVLMNGVILTSSSITNGGLAVTGNDAYGSVVKVTTNGFNVIYNSTIQSNQSGFKYNYFAWKNS